MEKPYDYVYSPDNDALTFFFECSDIGLIITNLLYLCRRIELLNFYC